MIDFRYHLVSLISVFLALAVGIVLGAGPLKEPIGSSLQSQVDALRTDRDGLRADLEHAQNDADQLTAFVEASAEDLLSEKLSDTAITVVRLPGADGAQAEAVVDRIGTAGGTVASDAELAEAALAPAGAELLAQLRELDDSLPQDDAAVLRTALVHALAPADPEAGDEAAEEGAEPTADPGEDAGAKTSSVSEETAAGLFSALTEAGVIASGDRGSADAVVMIAPVDPAEAAAEDPGADGVPGSEDTAEGGESAEATETAAPEEAAAELTAGADLARDFAGASRTVVAGSRASAVQGLLAELRNDGEGLSTVDSLDLAAGAVIVPLALEAAVEGRAGNYGTTQSSDSVLPEAP
ncbi:MULTISPECIES: copper transporter [Brevibacterium]|uniref:Copper transport outer membrane protein, MctB n=1 Tax=Brevibacterium salitolerans TaxID=1403566 RepID=A0ABP5IXQ7_9MICO|nr:copper transporter [Brevibacterium sp.]